MGKRTIIFGDIHGCLAEWQELLAKVSATSEDQLISIGDLVCKGPSTKNTLDLAMSLPNFQCVMGNHEWSLLKRWKKGTLEKSSNSYQKKAIKELSDNLDHYMNYIDQFPFYLKFPDFNVVHAGLRPDIALKDQKKSDLMTLRTVPPDKKPWYEYYDKPKLIVHGHWAVQGLVVRDNVIGLDTGCVYGKKLTAVILPEREIVSVNAKKVYHSIH